MRAGVAGWPVKHSLSPVIQGAWLAAADIAGTYETVEAPAERFAARVAALRADGWRGLNVTVPNKEAALALADRADAAAVSAGAANLLLFTDEGIEARNTDGIGLLAALAEQAPDVALQGAAVVVIGAGGAARGAVAALRAAGAGSILIANRTRERAQALAGLFDAQAVDWAALPEALSQATLVVNATTRGLNGADPLILPWPPAPRGGAVLDMVYRPLRTTFLEDAAAAGWATADGLAMLIGQARPSFEALFAAPVPASVNVRALCLRALAA
jgi:shikimate dehydrogenase